MWAHVAALATAVLLLAALPRAAGRPAGAPAPPPRRVLRAATSGIFRVHNQCDTAAPFNIAIYAQQFYYGGCDNTVADPSGSLCVRAGTYRANPSDFADVPFFSGADTVWITTLSHPSVPTEYVSNAARDYSAHLCGDAPDGSCSPYVWYEVRPASARRSPGSHGLAAA